MAGDTIQDMTRSELRLLIRDVVREVLQEFAQQVGDPDEGLEFRPEIAERLRTFLHERPEGRPVEEVARELGLDV